MAVTWWRCHVLAAEDANARPGRRCSLAKGCLVCCRNGRVSELALVIHGTVDYIGVYPQRAARPLDSIRFPSNCYYREVPSRIKCLLITARIPSSPQLLDETSSRRTWKVTSRMFLRMLWEINFCLILTISNFLCRNFDNDFTLSVAASLQMAR